MIGVGNTIGVNPAEEYLFVVMCIPVGAYFKGGLDPTNFIVSSYDRAAPNGTGAAKVGGTMQLAYFLENRRINVNSLIAFN